MQLHIQQQTMGYTGKLDNEFAMDGSVRYYEFNINEVAAYFDQTIKQQICYNELLQGSGYDRLLASQLLHVISKLCPMYDIKNF